MTTTRKSTKSHNVYHDDTCNRTSRESLPRIRKDHRYTKSVIISYNSKSSATVVKTCPEIFRYEDDLHVLTRSRRCGSDHEP